MGELQAFKFSVTIQAADFTVVSGLHALSEHCQQTGNKQIPWRGTGEDDWRRSGGRVTFRFTTQQYRADFIAEAKRLLLDSTWSVVDQSDDDPATPKRRL
jgi:hypothetical protein